MKNLICCFDGNYASIADTPFSPLTFSLHYGVGVFEGVRSYQTAKGTHIFRLEDHTKRLFRGAALLGLSIPFTETELNEMQRDVVALNSLGDAYIRPLVFLGAGSMSLDIHQNQVHIFVGAWPWTNLHADKEHGIHLKTVPLRKLATNSTHIQAKAIGHYLNSGIALHQAKTLGGDEALLLDQAGFVCEGSGQNLFFVKDHILHTPTTDTALEGITRDTVIQLAHHHHIEVKIGHYSLEELKCADEIFLTGTATEIAKVSQLDNQKIGLGVSPITTLLQAAFHQVCRTI